MFMHLAPPAAQVSLHIDVRPAFVNEAQRFIRVVCKDRLIAMCEGAGPGAIELLFAPEHAAFAENLALALSALPNIRQARVDRA